MNEDDDFEKTISDRLEVKKRLDAVIAFHHSSEGEGGITTGYCSGCDYVWPCPTVHLANGWSSWEDCFEAHYCEHIGMRY